MTGSDDSWRAPPRSVPHAAQAAANRWGTAQAIWERGEAWTFAELWSRARAAASALLGSGVGPGDRVAIWAPNRREWIVAALGVMTVGAAVVPLNTRFKGREAGDILRRSGARLLFTVESFLGVDYRALLADETLPALVETVLLDSGFDAFLAAGGGAGDPAVDAALDGVGLTTVSDILFTSGTSGSPKGVVMTHGHVLPQTIAWIANTRLGEDDRYLIVNPFFHAFGMKSGWIACLLAGARIVPMPQFDVDQAIALIEKQRITFLPGPPTIFQMLLAELDRRPWDCSSLRSGSTGAAIIPPSLVERMLRDLGMVNLVTAYGMTECINIASCVPGDSAETIAQTCGRAFSGHQLRVVDATGVDRPMGEPGEIWVRGEGVMRGYLDDPEATARAIDPDGWLHTGDVGTLDARGYLRITDRLTDMFTSGGFNVYPAEVEKRLAEHPAIAQSAVVDAPDARLGAVGVAFVVLQPDHQVGEAELVTWARANMANYKVPRRFIAVSELPRNAGGKVLKTRLRADLSGDKP